jgi:hypothetical protein
MVEAERPVANPLRAATASHRSVTLLEGADSDHGERQER